MTQKTPKFWNVIEEQGSDTAILTFYGDVVETHPSDFWTGEKIDGLFIAQDEFLQDIEKLKDKKNITIKLNSGGGDLFTGVAIHNALKSLPAKKTVIIEGLAASAASVIACAGDTVAVYPGSVYMVHSPSVNFYERVNLKSLTVIQEMLEACEKAIAEIYSVKTGLSTDECLELITAETWLTGKEAIEKGFADTLADGNDDVQMTANNKYLFVNGVKKMNLSGLNLPKVLNVATAPADTTDKDKENCFDRKEEDEMEKLENKEQLLAAYPELCKELVNQAKAEAIDCERQRLKDIEAIENTIGDKALLNSAKYGEQPLDARDLAFIAMKQQAALGAAMKEAIKNDVENSGAAKVQSDAPAVDVAAENEKNKEAALNKIVNIARTLK